MAQSEHEPTSQPIQAPPQSIQAQPQPIQAPTEQIQAPSPPVQAPVRTPGPAVKPPLDRLGPQVVVGLFSAANGSSAKKDCPTLTFKSLGIIQIAGGFLAILCQSIISSMKSVIVFSGSGFWCGVTVRRTRKFTNRMIFE